MRHTRFELGFPRNRKVARLSDAAFRLWSSAIDHAREQRTDGLVEKSDLAVIPRGAGATGWKASVVAELVEAGLWHATNDGWLIHDFLVWQDSKAEVDRAREQARERMTAVRSNKQRSSEDVRANKKRTSEEVCSGTSDSPSDSDLSKEANKSREPNQKPRATKWSRFPADFEPNAEHRKIAAERGVDLALELAKIRDWEFQKPRTDPAATLRNWLREARPTLTPRKVSPLEQDPGRVAAEKSKREAEFQERRRAELEAAAAKIQANGGPAPSPAEVKNLTGGLFNG